MTTGLRESKTKAKECIRSADWGGAYDALSECRGNDANDPEYHALVAHVLRSQNRVSEALDVIRASEKTCASPEMLVTKGKIYRDQGNYDLALDAYREALKMNSGHADAHCQIGILEQHAGRHKEAREAFERAVELEPTHGIHWLCLGKSCAHLGDAELAEEHYARAESAFKADATDNRLYNMACLASVRGDIEQACELFEGFAKLHPYVFAWAEEDEDLMALRSDPRFKIISDRYDVRGKQNERDSVSDSI